MKRNLVRLVLASLLVLPLAVACSSSDEGAVPTGAPAAEQAKADGATVIDVRTPEEFAAGHVAGATNLNYESSDFASQVAELEQGDTYVVYCRSGRRSALAAAEMTAAGLTVLDAGAMQQMLDAGYQLG